MSGAYSISWNSSFSNTTEPLLVATLRPTSKADSSVCETWPRWMSFQSWRRPWPMLSPWVSIALRCASGLRAMKLLGDAASIHCRTAKRTRARVFSSPWTLSASCMRVRALSR